MAVKMAEHHARAERGARARALGNAGGKARPQRRRERRQTLAQRGFGDVHGLCARSEQRARLPFGRGSQRRAAARLHLEGCRARLRKRCEHRKQRKRKPCRQ